ncbi:MAG: AAC(3) family N-acetyltransferase [Ignavibacterium sp.]
MDFIEYLKSMGLKEKQNLIVHSSYKKIKSAFPQITPSEIIDELKKIITNEGSIIFPVFTYCFKKSTGDYEVFHREKSVSKVGILSEIFRLSSEVIRTNSATHSFALWGRITNEFDTANSPESPLGKESVLEWLTKNPNSYVIMLGTNFSSLSYGHYLEIVARVPWFDFSPWDHLNVLPIGVSTDGEQSLKEIPGCSKSFVNFEKYLLDKKLIEQFKISELTSSFISIRLLYEEGVKYFKENYSELLCTENTCPACDSRRRKFL